MRYISLILGLLFLWSGASSVEAQESSPIREIPFAGLEDAAMASWDVRGPLIYYNPDLMNKVGPVVGSFFLLHERAHHLLGHLENVIRSGAAGDTEMLKGFEIEADCWAARQVPASAAEEVAVFFEQTQGAESYDHVHATGFERGRRIRACAAGVEAPREEVGSPRNLPVPSTATPGRPLPRQPEVEKPPVQRDPLRTPASRGAIRQAMVPLEREDLIAARGAEGQFITDVFFDRGKWFALLSAPMHLKHQILLQDTEFPVEQIDSLFKQDYRIDFMRFYEGSFFVVLSTAEGTRPREQHIRLEEEIENFSNIDTGLALKQLLWGGDGWYGLLEGAGNIEHQQWFVQPEEHFWGQLRLLQQEGRYTLEGLERSDDVWIALLSRRGHEGEKRQRLINEVRDLQRTWKQWADRGYWLKRIEEGQEGYILLFEERSAGY